MAKEIKWECLTSDEAKTLNELRNNGKEVYAAPIVIEHSWRRLESAGASTGPGILGMSGLRFISPRAMRRPTVFFLANSELVTGMTTGTAAAWFQAKHD